MMEGVSPVLWALLTAIGGSLITALGVVWKMYISANKDKERVQTEKLELVLTFSEKRQNDNAKNVEMLLKVQHGFEALMKFSNKLEGMISVSEKQEIIRTFHDIRDDVKEVKTRILSPR